MTTTKPLAAFTIVFWLIQPIDLVQTWLVYQDMMAEVAALPTAGLTPEQLAEERELISYTIYGILALFALIYALLIWAWAAITMRASNIARWLYTIWASLGVLGWPVGLGEMDGVETAVSAASVLLTLVAIYLLHRRAAREWFRASGNPIDPETFR